MTRRPNTIGDAILSADQPPPEILAEIDAGLDEIFDSDDGKSHPDAVPGEELEVYAGVTEADIRSDYQTEKTELAKLGPDVQLNRAERRLALLFYLSRSCRHSGWYKADKEEAPRQSEDAQADKAAKPTGVLVPLSIETRFTAKFISDTILSSAEEGLLKIRSRPGKHYSGGITKVITNVGVKKRCQEVLAQEELDKAEAYLIYGGLYNIIILRREINHEQRVLHDDLTEFGDLSALRTLDDIEAHYRELRETQREQLAILDSSRSYRN